MPVMTTNACWQPSATAVLMQLLPQAVPHDVWPGHTWRLPGADGARATRPRGGRPLCCTARTTRQRRRRSSWTFGRRQATPSCERGRRLPDGVRWRLLFLNASTAMATCAAGRSGARTPTSPRVIWRYQPVQRRTSSSPKADVTLGDVKAAPTRPAAPATRPTSPTWCSVAHSPRTLAAHSGSSHAAAPAASGASQVSGDRSAAANAGHCPRPDVTRQEARVDIVDSRERFSNSKRLHLSLGDVSPQAYEV